MRKHLKIFIYIASVVVFVFLLSCCSKEKNDGSVAFQQLELLKSVSIDVPEPSGVCFGPDKKSLLVVSDNDGCVYELALDGTVLRKINLQLNDAEAVAFSYEDHLITVAEEASRMLSQFNYSDGTFVDEYIIKLEQNSKNKGLEGLAWSEVEKCFLILNEAKPALLMKWNNKKTLFWTQQLDFARDYSGISASDKAGCYWIVSDQSRAVFKWSVAQGVIKKYNLPVDSYEGVVVDEDKDLLYLVNDDGAKLELFKILN